MCVCVRVRLPNTVSVCAYPILCVCAYPILCVRVSVLTLYCELKALVIWSIVNLQSTEPVSTMLLLLVNSTYTISCIKYAPAAGEGVLDDNRECNAVQSR